MKKSNYFSKKSIKTIKKKEKKIQKKFIKQKNVINTANLKTMKDVKEIYMNMIVLARKYFLVHLKKEKNIMEKSIIF